MLPKYYPKSIKQDLKHPYRTELVNHIDLWKKLENPKTEKVKHQYAKKEREINKQKALLEAKMELLENQKKQK